MTAGLPTKRTSGTKMKVEAGRNTHFDFHNPKLATTSQISIVRSVSECRDLSNLSLVPVG